MAKRTAEGKIITVNRKARHDYFVLEAYEAGIELAGTEVKSIRQGGVNLKDSWCSVDHGELFLKGAHKGISSTRTRSGCAGCSCTSRRSSASTARSSRTA